MDVVNNNVKGYGRELINHTEISFDLSQEDPHPPTITMLRVINQDNRIAVKIDEPENSIIEIAAGDFGAMWNPTKYMKKPNIEILWSIDEENFYPLQAVEDESRFHVSYGNVFTVSLDPLKAADIQDKWINIVVTLTDETGNIQKQTLSSLFYCSNNLGIDNENNLLCKSNVFPNPFTEKISIELDNSISGLTYFEIYDITGRIIHQQKTDANNTKSFTYNGKHLKEGVYFYGIYNGGNVVSGKMVKK